MDFKDLVQKRRSVRKFTGEKVTADELNVILRAGLMAPTGHGLRGWHFAVVEDSATLAAISMCRAMGSEFVKDAAAAIVVAYDPSTSDVWVEDATIAAVTMQYQATDLGLGSCWCQVRARKNADGTDSSEIVRTAVGLPDNLEVECVIGLGHPAVERKLQDEAKLRWDSVKR